MPKMAAILDVLRIVTPEGSSQPSFDLYAARPPGPAIAGPDPALWGAGTKVDRFELKDDDWKYSVDLFEIKPRRAPEADDVSRLLLAAVASALDQGAGVAWFMFDGAFENVATLATAWGAKNTYAIGAVGSTPLLALDAVERASPEWLERVRAAVGTYGK